MNATITEIPVDDLIPTEDNPRFIFDRGSFDSLTASIKEHGVQQPLLARAHPKKKGKYDLRAGMRRLEAAKKAGLQIVPVIVREMTDQAAMDATVIENLQRENLHPLEECIGIQRLLDVGRACEDIARSLGKTPQWVARRAQLTKLSEKWRRAIMKPEDGSRIPHWPVAIYEQVAALPHKVQDVVLKDRRYLGDPKPKLFGEWLSANYTRRLQNAPWKKDDETLVPNVGPCTKCSKRSGTQPLLFDHHDPNIPDGRIGRHEVCLDPDCFATKVIAGIKIKIEEAKKEYGKDLLVLFARYGSSLQMAINQMIEKIPGIPKAHMDDYNIMKKKDKGAKPAIIATQARLGALAWARPWNYASPSYKEERPKGTPTPLKERKAQLERRRRGYVINAIRQKLAEAPRGLLAKFYKTPMRLMALVAAFGTNEKYDFISGSIGGNRWDKYRELRKKSGDASRDEVVDQVVMVFEKRLRFFDLHSIDQFYTEAKEIASLLEINIASLDKEAAEKIPVPKSWKNLSPDGTPKKIKKKPETKAKSKKGEKPKGTKKARRGKRQKAGKKRLSTKR